MSIKVLNQHGGIVEEVCWKANQEKNDHPTSAQKCRRRVKDLSRPHLRVLHQAWKDGQ